MNAPTPYPPSPRRTRRFTEILWTPLLWGLPFALFFGTLWGGTWEAYRISYVVSLVFAYVIRISVFVVERLVAPRVRARVAAGRYPWLREGGIFMVTSMVAALLAAALVDRFVMHNFLDGPRAWRITALYSALFSILVGGIVYARVFYRVSVERALQVERMRAELARAEYRALRAQVHPHFLFNTLNTIAALIAEDPRAAEDVVTRLADVFRHSLASANGEHARFGDELEFLRAYLAIERARLGERLRFEESVEPGLEAVPVPGLLFQPLLENAVKYAAAERESGGTVRLEARREGDSLRVTISDDGPGIAPGARPRGHGVGLESVRERLRLAGEGHALHIDSAPGRGTRVTVTLPLHPSVPSPSPVPVPKELPTCD
jgi:signal transduction histidine kinase